jgi:methylated-DNA-[protein]-cysteine S-methyltransferase
MATTSTLATAVVVDTSLGFVGIALGSTGIRRSTLLHRTRDSAQRELRAFDAVEGADERAGEIESLLQRYAAGDRAALGDYPVELDGYTDLQRRTWLTLRDIPPGETRSYGWLAEKAGLGRGGARAVGTMNGENPIPLWLPCHRVIASDGTLGGFAGGLAMKTLLLEHEGALPRNMFAR